ncbi:MAG: radical SAM protein [Spirochaetes bacterium]|nr:radical SAM protein [Spirochaetota bacterium]
MLCAAVYSQGCKLNQLEGEALADAFRKAGFSHEPAPPDIIVINTCTVTSKSDQKARRIIRKALRENPAACVLVTGCLAQLEEAAIQALEKDCGGAAGRLHVFKADEKNALLDLPFALANGIFADRLDAAGGAGLSSFVKGWKEGGGRLLEKSAGGGFHFAPGDSPLRTRGFLKVQDGCGRSCTFCRARLARGAPRSLGQDAALQELRRLEEKGYAEAVIAGLNITEYEGGLGALLGFLLAGTKNIGIRLSSLEPDRIDGELGRAIGDRRVRPHFHLAVQSGSQGVLEKMGRFYDGSAVEAAVELFRAAKDDPFLACDIIAGFPGETEADFEQTLELCRKIDFAWIHVFPYSRRPGTAAYDFPQKTGEKEIARRADLLQALARQGREGYARRWLGREVSALVEKSEPGKAFCRGVSENYLKLQIGLKPGDAPPPPGTVLPCKISAVETQGFNLNGHDALAEVLRNH